MTGAKGREGSRKEEQGRSREMERKGKGRMDKRKKRRYC